MNNFESPFTLKKIKKALRKHNPFWDRCLLSQNEKFNFTKTVRFKVLSSKGCRKSTSFKDIPKMN